MSSDVYGGIVLTTMEWFSKCLETGCSIFLFPQNRNPRVNKLSPGSICLILVKEGIRGMGLRAMYRPGDAVRLIPHL
jgi:hypothetical protein